jgi:undecaprenyl-diphosphatase
MHAILEILKAADQWLFLLVNRIATHPILDAVMPLFRESTVWIPLYLFFIVFVFVNFSKKGWVWLLFALVNVLLTDQLSSSVIKKIVQRPRPCADPVFYSKVNLLLDHCSGGYSFTSSHAANHFGVATFLYVTLGNYLGRWKKLLFVWACLISYAQVYVGVHYPADVLVGALVGFLVGKMVSSLYGKAENLVNP